MSDLLGFASGAIAAVTSDEAWLAAMLDVERAIARAGASAGRIPPEAADAIAAGCDPARFDLDAIAARARDDATPVPALVADLRALVPAPAARFVHLGATSQDIVDSAAMLVTARAIDVIRADLVACADLVAGLARAHRDTPQVGRTLLQHAAPITFGFACACWLAGLDEADEALVRLRRDRLALQFGGPVGTGHPIAATGTSADFTDLVAAELGLRRPPAPWHTARGRIVAIAGALAETATALATIALDVTLLASSDIAELGLASAGGSSSMPHKRNPAAAVIVTASAHRVPGLVATLVAGAPQELQRSAGRWQAEWPTLTELLRVTGTAAAQARAMLDGLRVDADRMRANLAASAVADVPGALDAAAAATDSALSRRPTPPSDRS